MPGIEYVDWNSIETKLRKKFSGKEINLLYDKWIDYGYIHNGAYQYFSFDENDSPIEQEVQRLLDEEEADHIHFSW